MFRRSAHESITALTTDLNNWIAVWNNNPKPFVRHKTADQILNGLKKYLTNPDARHWLGLGDAEVIDVQSELLAE